MAYVEKRILKSGTRYYVRFEVDGVRKCKGGFSRKRDAVAYRLHVESELASGTHGMRGDIPFAEYAREWLEDCEGNVKPRTHTDYEQVLRKHLIPFFGKMTLDSIVVADVRRYLRRKEKSELSNATTNKTLRVLKMVMRTAVVDKRLRDNPAGYVKRLRQPPREMDFLDPAEIRRLLEASPPKYHALFATAIFTGSRQGELFALRWGDIDLNRGIVFILRSYHPDQGFTEPKTESSRRSISMSPELVNILMEHGGNSDRKPDDLVFPNKVGGPMDRGNLIQRGFYPALEGAGLRRIRFHDLRHTYATCLIALGENVKFIQASMGHANISTTLDDYGHLFPETSRGVGGRFDKLVFSDDVPPLPRKGSAPEGNS